MKKLLMVLLAVLMAFTLVACGKDNSDNTGDDGEDQPTFDTSAVDLSTLKLSDTKNLVVPESREINENDSIEIKFTENKFDLDQVLTKING